MLIQEPTRLLHTICSSNIQTLTSSVLRFVSQLNLFFSISHVALLIMSVIGKYYTEGLKVMQKVMTKYYNVELILIMTVWIQYNERRAGMGYYTFVIMKLQ